jgi:alkylated DNA repair dioxygenase AlkB
MPTIDGRPYYAFDAQAAIVNYYQPGDTLAAHKDESEWDVRIGGCDELVNIVYNRRCSHQHSPEFVALVAYVDHPLVSISIGQSAVYLSGTCDASKPAVPLWLRHGDVLVRACVCVRLFWRTCALTFITSFLKFC